MKKTILFVVTVLVFAFGIGITVKAAYGKENAGKFSEEEYRIMEEEYKHEARRILLEKGCKNAGITLTYVIDTEENREYVIAVHHSRLDKMEDQELVLLKNRLQKSGEEILMTDVSFKII